MPELFGTGYTRAGLLRRVGRPEQVAGVRLVTIGDGQGVRVLEFRTGIGWRRARRATTTWRSVRCPARPLSASSRTG
jgi:hypothetical protein